MRYSRFVLFLVVLAFLGLFALLVFRGKEDSLSNELKLRSANDGLAIVRAQSNHIEVVRFDGRSEDVENPRGSATAWVSSNAEAIAWVTNLGPNSRDGACPTAIFVDMLDGSLLAELPGSIINLTWLSVSNDGLHVVFYGTYKPVGSGTLNVPDNSSRWLTGVQLVDFAQKKISSVRLTDSDERIGSISWAPQRDRFVYDHLGKVYVYDLSARSSKSIAAGTNPSWSPNGQFIAFRSTKGEASLIEAGSQRESRLSPERTILWGVHWSPDSRYVMFSERTGLWSNLWHGNILLGPSAHMVVYSLEKRQGLPVFDFDFKGGDDRGFFWIENYRTFVSGLTKATSGSCTTESWLVQ